MSSIAAALFGLAAISWLAHKRMPAVLATTLLMFSLTYRIIDIAYVDLAGPIYAIELERFVGGNSGTPYFVVSVLCLVLPLAYLFRPHALLAGVTSPLPNSGYLQFVRRAGFGAVIALLMILYGDMLRIGTIPLFVGMDRIEYNQIAGIFHNPVYTLGFIPAGLLGILTVLPRLQGRALSIPAILLFLVLLMYWALTGSRFSAFLLAVCYFAMPFAAVVALRRAGALAPIGQNDPWAALLSARVIVPIASLLAAVAIGGLLVNSYYEVRSYADPVYQIFQRVLVQPVEIFSSRWDLALTGRMEGLNWQAINEVLLDPEDPNANTTMRYLMIQELGYFRAMELLNYGTQYAGGYPEIFLEMFGIYPAIPIMLAIGSATAFLARMVVRNTLRGYIGSAMLTIYVMFAFSLTYVGGMVNSLIAGSLALKVLALILVSLFERRIVLQGANGARASAGAWLSPSPVPPVGARPVGGTV